MNVKFMSLVVAGFLATGFGFGFGVSASGQPFELEVNDTPIGSFTLRGNIPQSTYSCGLDHIA